MNSAEPAWRWLGCLWLIFLLRGLFYVSFVPLWEGFDEWSHYAVVQTMVTSGRLLIGANAAIFSLVRGVLLRPAG